MNGTLNPSLGSGYLEIRRIFLFSNSGILLLLELLPKVSAKTFAFFIIIFIDFTVIKNWFTFIIFPLNFFNLGASFRGRSTNFLNLKGQSEWFLKKPLNNRPVC